MALAARICNMFPFLLLQHVSYCISHRWGQEKNNVKDFSNDHDLLRSTPSIKQAILDNFPPQLLLFSQWMSEQDRKQGADSSKHYNTKIMYAKKKKKKKKIQ